MVTITQEKRGDVDLITIAGRLDGRNASKLHSMLEERLDKGRYRLVINLAEVSYINSTFLRQLVWAQTECKKQEGDVRLAALSERMKELFGPNVVGPRFWIFNDNSAAIDSFHE